MSLQYIIDGYNIIHHPTFIKHINKNIENQRTILLELVRTKRLTGSFKNKMTVVFDGYPSPQDNQGLNNDTRINIIFSCKISADEKIKRMVEESANRKNIVVVSDDKEIKFIVKSLGAKQMGIDDFINPKEKFQRDPKRDLLKPELSYSQIHKINQELRKIWLNK